MYNKNLLNAAQNLENIITAMQKSLAVYQAKPNCNRAAVSIQQNQINQLASINNILIDLLELDKENAKLIADKTEQINKLYCICFYHGIDNLPLLLNRGTAAQWQEELAYLRKQNLVQTPQAILYTN
jgi:hypothetical protein